MDEETLTVWLDTALLMLGGFVLMTILMLAAVNPAAESAETAQTPGNVIIEAQWDSGSDADVDLWVQAPGDRPIGYSNKSGRTFSLLRDDLGKRNDATDLNYEVSYSRGMPEGEYIVNVHLYRAVGIPFPLNVKVAARVKAKPQDSARPITVTTVQLRHENHEVTAFRFRLDRNGALVPGSLNTVHRELRVAAR